MTNYKKRLVAASLTLVAASLASTVMTSYASAQCVECAIYPDRDPLNGGAETPAAKAAHPGGPNGATAPSSSAASRNANNAHAEMRSHRGHHAAGSAERPR